MQKGAGQSVVIGHSEDLLERRERLLEAKRERDAEKRREQIEILEWLNEGKENPVVYFR